MRKEDFTALGIPDDLAEKAAKASEEELKGYVPRARLNEEIQKKKNAEETLESVKTELDTLKASAGDSEQMKEQIKKLQAELENKEKKHADEIAGMRLDNALQAAVSGTAQDAALVAGLIDRSKIILGDDGNFTGLDEQVKALRESKPFLFKDGDGYPDVRDGGEPNSTGGKKSTRDLFAEALDGTL